ncbi:MAG TPA: hypothetical protein K8V81_06945 [Brachybacterium massiliense]|uniref:Uncharacterized protein n=1 Tax=Brachybacterium massiliense TaxID=1755098 RepID=A0A921SX74_9MICO|nr:hypothetical protein [Brachybacterium massiliense]
MDLTELGAGHGGERIQHLDLNGGENGIAQHGDGAEHADQARVPRGR